MSILTLGSLWPSESKGGMNCEGHRVATRREDLDEYVESNPVQESGVMRGGETLPDPYRAGAIAVLYPESPDPMELNWLLETKDFEIFLRAWHEGGYARECHEYDSGYTNKVCLLFGSKEAALKAAPELFKRRCKWDPVEEQILVLDWPQRKEDSDAG